MTDEFNEFVKRQIKNHAKRTGMKTGDAHPYARHSSRAAAFEAWENRQKRINVLESALQDIIDCWDGEGGVHDILPFVELARDLLKEKSHD